VVEQPLFAACGRAHFETEQLRFFDDLPACLNSNPCDVALLSSVLPYVEQPHALLQMVSQNAAAVIIDRTPVWTGMPDRLTLQSVPASIYGFATSYPAWILNRESILAHFEAHFRTVFEFDALAGFVKVAGSLARDTGWLFER
jgi:putative methyltransferase (TIGR04325 family)